MCALRGVGISLAALATVAVVGRAATALSAPKRGEAGLGKIAFSVQHGDNDAPWDIYVVRTDGRWTLRKKTRLNEADPAWSPDGRHITFEAWSGYAEGPGSDWVYTMNPDGTHRRRLAHGEGPQWSPDGRRIAYVKDGIYVMNSDGTGQKRLTRSCACDSGDWDPRWSPDGKQIAFTRETTYDVYIVNAGGGHERRLTRTGDSFVKQWAPGRKILFTYGSLTGAGPAAGVYIVSPDGSRRRQVVSTGSYEEAGGGPPARWSLDGRQIVYADSHGVSTVRPRDGFVRRLARGGHAPAWGPGDREVAFTISVYDNERRAGVWIVNRDGRGARRIATASEECYDPTWAPR